MEILGMTDTVETPVVTAQAMAVAATRRKAKPATARKRVAAKKPWISSTAATYGRRARRATTRGN